MNNNDPWAKYQATSTPTAPLPAPASSKRIEGTLQQEVTEAIRKELAAATQQRYVRYRSRPT